MSIATKTGDKGTTALMYGRRVSKVNTRVEAYGTVDELNSALGMVRAHVSDPFITTPIFNIQKQLVVLMGELAVAPEDQERYVKDGYDSVTGEMVDAITAIIDDLEKNKKVSFTHWATPGFNLASAALDVARTTCRRAERRVVELGEAGEVINAETVRYLNRLSDLCWLFARYVETQAEAASL
ncbi:MAG TPA: cob(I)yrinic acid a,c-diamide adenosyltransferase [Chthoniobacterales bacterium]|jgi:cob(I)alamin adenosyltransferase